jgi:hypothetical protein
MKAGPYKGKMKMCSEIFEKIIIKTIYRPIKENGVWK